MNKCYFGDCRESLKQLITDGVRVQTCVTSPPYFGLRDYGTATWEGGDDECDHVVGEIRTGLGMAALSEKYRGGGKKVSEPKPLVAKEQCPKCGAKRIDDQIGLEKTPEEFIETMVEVFRLVRDVLADDGTLWLNLGSSYFNTPPVSSSHGIDPNQSPLLRRDLSCGTDGTKPQYSPNDDRAYHGSCDELQAEMPNHRVGSVHNDQSAGPDVSPLSQTSRDNGQLDSAQELPDALLPDAHPSTKPEFSFLPLGASSPLAPGGVCQQEVPTSSHDADPSEGSLVCSPDTSRMSPPLVVRTKGKESFFSACQRSDCKGVGKCGLCWCSLSIPSLTFKSKDLLSIPQLVAFALQAAGWYLRQDIIWHKPNPMPESVTDRCTKAHEYIFLMSKSPRYYYDADAIKEDVADTAHRRGSMKTPDGWDTSKGEGGHGSFHKAGRAKGVTPKSAPPGSGIKANESFHAATWDLVDKRNKRSVWTVPTQSYSEAHFATFPTKLIEPCILAGSRVDDIVLDPFFGSGTTGEVAQALGRQWIGCELNAEYKSLQDQRVQQHSLNL